MSLQVQYGDPFGRGVDHLLAVRGIAVLVEVETRASRFIGQPVSGSIHVFGGGCCAISSVKEPKNSAVAADEANRMRKRACVDCVT
ncbi:MAG TPA: hypothetical protein VG168_08030 [Bryobacteraceae bacterium]|nr:hypothetical protein [Bryobacteraceae bacterium]